MAFLEITTGTGEPQRFSIERDSVTIGRAADNDLALAEDDIVSSHHCRIDREGGKYTLVDLQSTNGTLVNGEAVQECRLKPGDEITVGKTVLTFGGDDVEVEPAAEAAPEEAAAAAASEPPAEPLTGLPAGFEPRRNARGLNVGVVLLVLAVVIATTVWFILSLLKP